MPTATPPTQAEIDAANEVLRRANDARLAEEEAKVAPLRNICQSEAFAEVKAAVEALPLEFQVDERYGPQVTALRSILRSFAGMLPLPTSAPIDPPA